MVTEKYLLLNSKGIFESDGIPRYGNSIEVPSIYYTDLYDTSL
jgi:hypothetical protein